MNKDKFNSAMSKITASEEFKKRIKASIEMQPSKDNKFKMKKLIPIFTILILVISISSMLKPPLSNKSDEVKISQEFKIIGDNSNAEACYISVVYIDGYAYSPSEWLSYSRGSEVNSQDVVRGKKLGEVTLDLKGKKYTGTPPDFSSTHDLGSEIYEIKNMKKERAVILKDGDYEVVFYRERKAILSEKEQIGLKVSDVFNMMTNVPKVTAIELRSEEDGSWMRTIKEEQLNSIINNEFPKLLLKNHGELEVDPYIYNDRIPINLIFGDGTAMHLQVLPESKYAAIFGAYIPLSEEFISILQGLSNEGEKYSRMTQLIPYSQDEVSYLYIMDFLEQNQILCKEPKWSSSALYGLLGYYRVLKADEDIDGKLVMIISIGKSEKDSIYIELYENENNEIFIKTNDSFYKIVKGQLRYKHLKDYIYNYTN
jgi:hypothetical protein